MKSACVIRSYDEKRTYNDLEKKKSILGVNARKESDLQLHAILGLIIIKYCRNLAIFHTQI